MLALGAVDRLALADREHRDDSAVHNAELRSGAPAADGAKRRSPPASSHSPN